jgi:hypothetical protein
MKCKPHARMQSKPVVVALPCVPAAHCREAAAVAEPSARPRHPRGEDDEMRKQGFFDPQGAASRNCSPVENRRALLTCDTVSAMQKVDTAHNYFPSSCYHLCAHGEGKDATE